MLRQINGYTPPTPRMPVGRFASGGLVQQPGPDFSGLEDAVREGMRGGIGTIRAEVVLADLHGKQADLQRKENKASF